MTSSTSADLVTQVKDHIQGERHRLFPDDMPETPLRHLEYYLKVHLAGSKTLRTLETGCGSSTLVFSRYAKSHIAHLGPENFQDRVDFLKRNPFRKTSQVKFVPWAIPDADTEDELDLVLLNGSQAYPAPELALIAVLKRIKPHGILMIADIDVPSVGNLFRFLEQDEMFFSNGIAQQTGVLVRSTAPVLDHVRAPWHRQAYNVQHYRGPSAAAYKVASALPMHVEFDGRLMRLGPQFERGFTLLEGRPATEGHFSRFRLPFQRELQGDVILTLELEALGLPERPNAGCTVQVNHQPVADVAFGLEAMHKVEVTVPAAARREIDVILMNHDVRSAGELQTLRDRGLFDASMPNVVLRSIGCRPASASSPAAAENSLPDEPLRKAEGAIVSFGCRGQTIRFFVQDAHDSIQAHHAVGEFYETEELDLLTRHVPPAARILDIGANIGNHAVWFEKIMRAKRIVPFEPQNRMIAMFRTNCLLNGLVTIDESHLGVALGDVDGSGTVAIDQAFNPAGARIEQGGDGGIPIRVGDELLDGQDFDLIKIDVEGAEIQVIKGLRKLIARCRPILFVEVWEENRAAFDMLMDEVDYKVDDSFRRYDIATNLLLRPKSTQSRSAKG